MTARWRSTSRRVRQTHWRPVIRTLPRTPDSDFPAPALPPTGRADAKPFVGTFKDEALIAEFHEAADGAGRNLTLHDKTFPAAAHIDGGKLVGTFESGGTKFDFTASIDGDVMSLKSGSKTYTLKKPAENPLDPGRRRAASAKEST